MARCLMLVEGPYDELRVSLLKMIFDDKKLEIVPFKCDKLKSSKYSKEYKENIRNLLSIDKTFCLDDFDEIAQLLDTDGCFIPIENIVEDTTLPHIKYEETTISVTDLNSALGDFKYKRENINFFLKTNYILLYYCSTNIDHAFDNSQNPTNKEKRKYALEMRKELENKPKEIVRNIVMTNACHTLSYDESWDYIKEGTHSLEPSTNLTIFLVSHYDQLIDEAKKELINIYGEQDINNAFNNSKILVNKNRNTMLKSDK